jgi:hypothetical protein
MFRNPEDYFDFNGYVLVNCKLQLRLEFIILEVVWFGKPGIPVVQI